MNKHEITNALAIAEMHPLFKAISWVALATSDDESRHQLCQIRIEKAELIYDIVATDGRRLHHAKYDAGLFDTDICEIEPGNYIVISTSKKFAVIAKSEIADYPNWKNVIPDHNAKNSVRVSARTTASICLATKKLMATDYLMDACGFGIACKKGDSLDIYYDCGNSDSDAVVMQNEIGVVVIMPMKFDAPEIKDQRKATAIIPEIAEHLQDEKETEVEG